MHFINYKGTIRSEDDVVIPYWNRSFLYGDGLFETIRMVKAKLLFLNDHWSRLQKSANVLRLILPKGFTKEYLEESIFAFSKQNRIPGNARVRLTIFREGRGRYLPESSEAGFLLDIEEMGPVEYSLNKKGLTAGLFTEAKKTMDSLSNLKTCNSLVYVLASIYTRENGWDDCFVTNGEGKIIEATASNIFVVKDGIVYTPPLSEGPVEGIMRKQIFNFAEVKEIEITTAFLQSADEIFLTNVVSGIRWVEFYNDIQYGCSVSQKLLGQLNELVKI